MRISANGERQMFPVQTKSRRNSSSASLRRCRPTRPWCTTARRRSSPSCGSGREMSLTECLASPKGLRQRSPLWSRSDPLGDHGGDTTARRTAKYDRGTASGPRQRRTTRHGPAPHAARPHDAPTPQPIPERLRWQDRYKAGVVGVDLAALSPPLRSTRRGVTPAARRSSSPAPSSWRSPLAALRVARAWEPSVLGQGSLEFTRLLRGFVGAAVVVALVGLALDLPQARPWVFGVLPFAGALAVGGRMLLRKRLHRLRGQGRAMARVLAVGTEDAVTALVDRTRRAPHHGWQVAGVCTPTGAGPGGSPTVNGVPVVGDLDTVAALALDGPLRRRLRRADPRLDPEAAPAARLGPGGQPHPAGRRPRADGDRRPAAARRERRRASAPAPDPPHLRRSATAAQGRHRPARGAG